MRRIAISLLPFIVFAWTGCVSYRPRPLVPGELLEEVEQSRKLLPHELSGATQGDDEDDGESGGSGGTARESSPAFTFPKAAQWMRDHSPALANARAAYNQAEAVARIDTPIPNPGISLGPQLGTNLGGEGTSHKLQPMVEFGFTIPLSSRLRFQDDLNKALADEAWVKFIVIHRSEYLDLHKLYMEWVLARKNRKILEMIWESSLRSVRLTKRLAEAGSASALDAGLMDLEAAQREIEVLKARSEGAEMEKLLSQHIGIRADYFHEVPAGALPSLDVPVPDLEETKSMMVANNPELARLRAAYEVAEKALRLEIEKQYPDLELGPSFEGEPGEKKKTWGLSFGFEIPLFDLNQQAIASAEQEREKIRTAYKAALSRSLAALEGLYKEYALAKEKGRLLKEVILPKSEANLDIAMQSIQAASIDSLKFLETERSLWGVKRDALETEKSIRLLLCEMEQVTGVPLAFFPGEKTEAFSVVPGSKQEGEETRNKMETDTRTEVRE